MASRDLTAVQKLAARMAESIERSKRKEVLVFDFVGPDTDSTRWSEPAGGGKSKTMPSEVVTMLGRSLADDFSAALGQSLPKVNIRRWGQVYQTLTPDNFMPTLVEDPTTAWWVSNAARFDLFVWGDLERDSEGKLKLRVSCYEVRDGRPIQSLAVAIVLNYAARELVSVTAQEPMDTAYAAGGKNGITFPTCKYCPTATYPEAAVGHFAQGTVELEAVITQDGRAKDIKVLRALPYGFAESAILAVRRWEFKPAIGPDGKPTAVHQIVEVTFHLGAR